MHQNILLDKNEELHSELEPVRNFFQNQKFKKAENLVNDLLPDTVQRNNAFT